MVGLTFLFGGAALALLLAAAAPPVLERCWRYRQGCVTSRPAAGPALPAGPPQPGPARQAGPPTQAAPAEQGQVDVEQLTLLELCHRWRASYLLLQRTTDLTSRVRLAHARQRYLDELERRDQIAFGRWLSAGPRPLATPRPTSSRRNDRDRLPAAAAGGRHGSSRRRDSAGT